MTGYLEQHYFPPAEEGRHSFEGYCDCSPRWRITEPEEASSIDGCWTLHIKHGSLEASDD